MIVHTTNSLSDGDKGNRELKAHAVHATLSPQLSADLQTQHFCTTNWDCALSASDTSQVLCPQLRSQRIKHFASVPLTLREQQLSRARDGFPDHCVTKEQQLRWRMCKPPISSTMLHESQKTCQGTNRENLGENPPALPCKTSGAFGAKRRKQPRYAAPAPTERRVWSPNKSCTSKRVRDNAKT